MYNTFIFVVTIQRVVIGPLCKCFLWFWIIFVMGLILMPLMLLSKIYIEDKAPSPEDVFLAIIKYEQNFECL